MRPLRHDDLAPPTLALILGIALAILFLWPRPADTTDPNISRGEVDYCDLPELDGNGLTADEIPKAFTPGCGYGRYPTPVLADCREPLAPGVVELRGLWLAEEGALPGHIERVEPCGIRTVVTAGGVIHDFRTDARWRTGSVMWTRCCARTSESPSTGWMACSASTPLMCRVPSSPVDATATSCSGPIHASRARVA